MTLGRLQLILWATLRFGYDPVPKAFRGIYVWFFWIGPLEIRWFR